GGGGVGRAGGRGALGKLALLVFRQRLVLLPAGLALVLGDVARLLEVQARLGALLRRHVRPLDHALVRPLLLLGRQLVEAAGHGEPALLAAIVERVPVVGQRPQHLALLRREIVPARAAGIGTSGGAGLGAACGRGGRGRRGGQDAGTEERRGGGERRS